MAVAGAVGVVSLQRPNRPIVTPVVGNLAHPHLFLLLSAPFAFGVQMMMSAGAAMVLFRFVIGPCGPRKGMAKTQLRFQSWLSALFLLALFGLIYAMVQGIPFRQPDKGVDLSVFGTVQSIAVGLFTTYLYPFELTSILLLVAAIGAIYLSRKKIDES